MTTRSGVENTVMYDVGPDRGALRASARPDDRLQGAQGRPDRQHPGRARCRREDGREADPRVRRPGLAAQPARRGHAAKLADKLREHVDQIRMGHELSKIVRDLPIDFDLVDRALGRLRPRHRRPAVPRVRVPDADRAAAADGGRVRRTADRALCGRSPRAATFRPRASPAGPRAGDHRATSAARAHRRAGRRERAPAPTRFRRGRRSRGRHRAPRRRRCRAIGADASVQRHRRPPRAFEPAPDLPTALAAAIVDPGRIEVRGADRIADLDDWLSAQSAVGVRLLLDDPRPRRGNPVALAVAGTDGRVVAADGPEASDDLRHRLERLGTPLVGHEVKPLLVAAFAEDESATPTPIAFDTQIAAYILNASLRSQTIADVVAENLDQILPPPAELPGHGTRGPRGTLGHRGSRAARTQTRETQVSTAYSARSSCR